jgi:mRNA interferase MazF
MSTTAPTRGEIWFVDLNPVRGHEQAGIRPALIISATTFNHGPANLVTVLPITTKDRSIPSHVKIKPTTSTLQKTSFIICEQIRTISQDRLTKRVGVINKDTLQSVEKIVGMMLGI